ncbi:expressed unknown protein [Seminavis robusta]|uniref:Uncharacterized protein n=1 Tax=Seminavis robusta TaxID=568900 RepID=A0A9N8ESL0_9STRA|nr:expressed unknown protein [Seminavis robusta]|eukprot:Sro1561_g282561.1  (108) ;mRNA; f:1820-2143
MVPRSLAPDSQAHKFHQCDQFPLSALLIIVSPPKTPQSPTLGEGKTGWNRNGGLYGSSYFRPIQKLSIKASNTIEVFGSIEQPKRGQNHFRYTLPSLLCNLLNTVDR